MTAVERAQALDPYLIVTTCSQRHTQSVIEDLRNDVLALAAENEAQAAGVLVLREAVAAALRRLKHYDYQAMEKTIARCQKALEDTQHLENKQ